jgi:putative FmdB family regulatory protein
MPTYAYKCTACGTSFDVVQSFSDSALTVHDECGGALRKLFSPVGVTFNGSGFYRTDSRSKPSSGSSDSSSGSSSGSGTGSSSSGSSSSGSSGSSSSGSGSSSGSSTSAPASTGASS